MFEFTDTLFPGLIDLHLISTLVYLVLIEPVSFDQSECCVRGQTRCIQNTMAFVQDLVSRYSRARLTCPLSSSLFRGRSRAATKLAAPKESLLAG